VLPMALNSRAGQQVTFGELDAADSLIAEVQVVTEATGAQFAAYADMGLTAYRGREAHGLALIDGWVDDAVSRGEGTGLTVGRWACAVFCNGFGRYEEALAAAREASARPEEIGLATWALVELIEAASRSEKPEPAAEALERLSETTQASGTDWALGIEARSRALASEGDTAESLYVEAIDRLRRAPSAVDLARAHLVYGEWLRRQRRRVDAREQLRIADEMLTAIGVEAFAQRAERELRATGETARKRMVETIDQLTPQERQIAQLARDGLTNPEIGGQLFISPRTVQYHLHKVFAKLDITSRNQLHGTLSRNAQAVPPGS
jgi:RNA polymerase sigma factor (sigma-70 family)